MTKSWHSNIPPALLCSLAFLLGALVSHPVAEIGMYDDYSYVRTAEVFARTGHLTYNGWGGALMGWIVLPAAFAIKLFGFSFTATRGVNVCLGAVTIYFIQRTFVHAGLTEANATFGTLTIGLGPLYFPLSVSFMTDVPSLFALVLTFYCCLRVLNAETDAAQQRWLLIGSVGDVFFGSVRQVAWLGVLFMIPSVLILLRRKRNVIKFGIAVWLVSVLAIASFVHWGSKQPFAVYSALPLTSVHLHELHTFGRNYANAALEALVLIVPVLLLHLGTASPKNRRIAVLFPLPFVVLVGALHTTKLGVKLLKLTFPMQGDPDEYLSVQGLFTQVAAKGARPILWGFVPRLLITALAAAGTIAVVQNIRKNWKRESTSTNQASSNANIFTTLFLWIPLLLVYACLLTTRALYDRILDRYTLPALVPLVLLVLLAFQRTSRGLRPTPLAILMLVLTGMYSVVITHDLFATYQASAVATKKLEYAGVPRTAIDAGWEYNSWTQYLQDGFIRGGALKNPPAPEFVDTKNDLTCPVQSHQTYPAVAPIYALALDPKECGGLAAEFSPTPFQTWLPYRTQEVFVVKRSRDERTSAVREFEEIGILNTDREVSRRGAGSGSRGNPYQLRF